LSVEDNPVTLLNGYRQYVVARMPNLRVLDYVKISQAERAGGIMAVSVEQRTKSGESASSSSSVSVLSEAERAALKIAVTQAKTKEELEILMKALDEGKLPDGFTY